VASEAADEEQGVEPAHGAGFCPFPRSDGPHDRATKVSLLLEMREHALQPQPEVGVGFPQATQTDPGFLLEISRESVDHGARRVVVFDTNGSAEPSEVHRLIGRLREAVDVPLFEAFDPSLVGLERKLDG
jgi:hypothetical protein